MVLNIQFFHLLRRLAERLVLSAVSLKLKNRTDLITRPEGGFQLARTHTGAETHVQQVNCQTGIPIRVDIITIRHC